MRKLRDRRGITLTEVLPVWPLRPERRSWALPSDWASLYRKETSVSRILALILAAATAEPVRKTNTSTMISSDTRVSTRVSPFWFFSFFIR